MEKFTEEMVDQQGKTPSVAISWRVTLSNKSRLRRIETEVMVAVLQELDQRITTEYEILMRDQQMQLYFNYFN